MNLMFYNFNDFSKNPQGIGPNGRRPTANAPNGKRPVTSGANINQNQMKT